MTRPLASIAGPLRQPVFRRIWTASLFSNLGQQVQAVAAAWTMVQLGSGPGMVALVQTATMLPIVLIALPAGAIADMYDRRKAAIVALLIAASGAALLLAFTFAERLSPPVLLAGCFIVGCGSALFSPAWQASVTEQVGREAMPAAVARYGVSANLARSVGPAVGGIIVATVGAAAAFTVNVLLYGPIIVALLMWRRVHVPPRLPPEGIGHAIRSGLRYVGYSPPIRRVLARALLASVGAAGIYAMAPLVASELLHGGASVYGALLGSFGAGAVSAILIVGPLRDRLSAQQAMACCGVATGSAIVAMALSPLLVLTAAAMFVAGGSWMVCMAVSNVAVQLSAPRWVAGRALATFQATVACGLALGAWGWGRLATEIGIAPTLLAAGALMLVSPLLGLLIPLTDVRGVDNESVPVEREPEVAMALTGRSGPIVIERDYDVPEHSAREFYSLMMQVQRVRERNGAYGVTLSRDIADPVRWVQRYHYPTWHDYLRARDRPTQTERNLGLQVAALLVEGSGVGYRRMLERPFGSVRWTDATPDRDGAVLQLPTGDGGS